MRRAHAANVLGKDPDELRAEALAHKGPSRRDVFLGTLGAAALIPLAAACGDNIKPEGEGPGVVIVGAGMAGLTAAHFLRVGGVRAQVYEASMRVGGRMYTDRSTLANGQLVELGGELVDSDHVVIPALMRSHGLTLDDLIEATAGLQQDSFVFSTDGVGAPSVEISEATIVAAFMPVAVKMGMAVARAEGMDAVSVAEFDRIDQMSIPDWLQMEAGLAPSTLIRRILELAYLEEFGLEVEEQSAWNLITLIDYETPDPFRVFGSSDERYHMHEGNDALPNRMAVQLEEQIHLDHALTKVVKTVNGYDLTFMTSAGPHVIAAAHVVYALPFTKLREVDLAEAGMSAEKLQIIRELGYGTNAKLMLQFSTRHWEVPTTARPMGSGGGAITDVGDLPRDGSALGTGLQTVWSTSRGQDGVEGILTNFVGGNRGIAIGEGTPESQAQIVLPWIDAVFPGTAAKYVPNTAVRMHWPSYPFTKGSYASYKKGQWAFFGKEGVREEDQHFCGEHCSEDYQGYMEGAAETGALVAGELFDDLELDYPPVLAALLTELTAARPRACFHGAYDKRMRISQIRARRG